MSRSAATLMAMAAVMLFAGCGGGSGKKGAGTVVQVGPRPAVARDGEFRTVIPRGYVNHTSVAQYFAQGPVEGGFPSSMIVVRQRVGKVVDLSTYVHEVLSAIRPSVRGISLQRLSVDGEPAFAVAYLASGTGTAKGIVTHVRQVLVKHGPWVFFIRDISPPGLYTASLGALDEVLRNWRWQ